MHIYFHDEFGYYTHAGEASPGDIPGSWQYPNNALPEPPPSPQPGMVARRKGFTWELTTEAERDAALAAIERVRETLMLHNPNGRLVKEVLAALDGAPEPEWEYRAKVVHPDWAGNYYIVFEHAPTRDELETPFYSTTHSAA